MRINQVMVSPSNHWNDWNKLSWAAMRDMPDVSGQEIAIGAWHHVSLEATFCDQKVVPVRPAPVLTIDTFSRRRYFFRKRLRVFQISDLELGVHKRGIVGAVATVFS
jgi:hypothetical protein